MQLTVPMDEDEAPQVSKPEHLPWYQAVSVIVVALAFMLVCLGLAVWVTL